MKLYILSVVLSVALCIAYVQAACDDASGSKESDDGEVKAWFKNIGCKIQKGAEDLHESAKPWADKIGSSAKEFGQNVAQKYDEIKHKLTDDASTTASSGVVYNAPTEKVPLAPISGGAGDAPKSDSVAAALPAPASVPVASGEKIDQMHEQKSTTVQPISIDDRFLLQQLDCPKGQVRDHTDKCRPSI